MSKLAYGAVTAFGSLAFAGASAADPPPPDYDYEWATIGSAWNRPTRPDEVPWHADKKIGRVTHRYRMSTTEVTVGQWLDFVRAYGPHWEGDPDDTDLTSLWIWFDGHDYHADAGREQWPVQTTFFNAMRYTNWLHNGKGSEKSDFESGAYELSSFWRDEYGFWHGQESRAADARFWIPSQDEWVKAGYFDPDRHGEGEAGYWRFNHRSDEQPISGLPGDGGETNAGLNGYPDFGMDILSYPWTQSPWGLYDMTGGESEWTETLEDSVYGDRYVLGSYLGGSVVDDLLGLGLTLAPHWAAGGIRVASTVPEPTGAAALIIVLAHMARRKRNTHESQCSRTNADVCGDLHVHTRDSR